MSATVILTDNPFAEELKTQMLQIEGEGEKWRFKYGSKSFPRIAMKILGTRHETSVDTGAPYHVPHVLVEDLIEFIRERAPEVVIMTLSAYECTFKAHFDKPQVPHQLA